jgi:TPR repeat protein
MLFKSGYSAPEQYTSTAQRYGAWTDIYATGATLYRAIAGERPVESTSRTLKDDLVPAVQIGKGRYRDGFLRAIDAALRLPLTARPQSIAAWRKELLGVGPTSRLVVSAAKGTGSNSQGRIVSLLKDVTPPFLKDEALADRIETARSAVSRELDRWTSRTRLGRQRVIGLGAALTAGLVLLGMDLLAPNLALNPLTHLKWLGKAAPGVEAKVDPAALVDRNTALRLAEPPPASTRPGAFARLPAKLGALVAEPGKGWLGARVAPVTTDMAKSFGLLTTKGAFLQDAAPDGAIGQAGGRAGDLILRVDGTDIADTADLRRLVQSKAPGEALVLEVWRFGTDGQAFKDVLIDLATRGDGYAMNWLGIYSKGSTVAPRDDSEAVRWFRKGAEASDAEAGFGLGSMIAEGRGTRKDLGEAQRVLLAAGKLGSIDAFIRLAQVLTEMRRSASEAKRQAGTMQIGADNGNVSAMLVLGDWYLSGFGVARNFGEAMRWYKRAAELGGAAGNTSIGVLYLGGIGVQRDDVQAAGYGRLGASQGDLAALRLLGYLYENGLGVERRDPELAAELVFQAIASGHDLSLNDMVQGAQKSSLEFRIALQRRLRDAGFYSGQVDGDFSQPTLSAVKALHERRPRVPANL